MKQINKYLLLAVLMIGMGAGFSACKDEPLREPSPVETSGPLAYFLDDNTKDILFSPADETKFQIKVGRINAGAEEKVPLNVEITKGKENLISLPSEAVFAAGQETTILNVDCSNMKLGDKLSLTLSFDEKAQTAYGTPEMTFSITRDYEWINKGAVEFIDELFGLGSGMVPIQMAKGTQLFRLVSPYNKLTEKQENPIPAGLHLSFYLDTNNGWKADKLPSGLQVTGTGYDVFYHNEGEPFAKYCSFTNVENAYSIKTVLRKSSDGGFVGPYPINFVWKTGYPGTLTDPYEGDAPLSIQWEADNASCTWHGDIFGDKAVGMYYLELPKNNGFVALELLGKYTDALAPLPAGTYTINKKGEEFTAVSGQNVAVEGKTGSYVSIPDANATLYLVEGTVTVAVEGANYTITLDGKSSAGATVKVTWKGALTTVAPPPPPPTPIKRNVLRPLRKARLAINR